MKLFICHLLLIFGAFTASGQDFCRPEIKDSLALHGLRLGQTPAQTQSALGNNLKINIKKNGFRVFFQNFINNKPPPTLPNVRAVYLRFFDQRLYQIELFYENKTQWQTPADFTADLSARMNIPLSLWQTEYGIAKINCGDFSIIADKVLNPRVQITDEIIRAKVEEIREND